MARGGKIIAEKIIKFRKAIVVVFVIITVLSSIAALTVSVNYDMKDYLPDEAGSTIAFKIMEDEFVGGVPANRVMIKDVSITEALQFKKKLAAVDGVSDVIWLDDVIDLKTPLEIADQELVETYYKDGHALFSFSIRDGEEVAITDEIYSLIGEENALAGESINTATQQKMAVTEALYASLLLVPIIIIILILSTRSWAEPLFFLIAIGVSVLINMGTNVFLGEVSFVTQSVAPILQLAVSLDYAIFLLHSFQYHRERTANVEKAMHLAMKSSFTAIFACAITTFFGFIALSFMEFEIGADLGLNLVKGILLSFISVMVFLPALTLLLYKWIDKTQHKPFLPSVKNAGQKVLKVRIPVLILVFLLIVPVFLAQSNNDFTYGIGDQPEETRTGRDLIMIREHFGESTPIVLLVPRGDLAKEEKLVKELEELEHMTSIVSYVSMASAVIPPEFLDKRITDQFFSQNYSRIILQTSTKTEGDEAFGLIEAVHERTEKYYDEPFYMAGESVTLYDIKDTVQKDNTFVNLLTILSLAFVLFVTFKSFSLPIILLLTIQTAVWINLSVPYFTNSPLIYMGYLLVSVIQLASTIDYAILLTDTYRIYRREMPAFEAIKKSINAKLFSITVSASILSSVGFILWLTSSNPIVSSVGLLLGRGALLALMMVVFFLPATLLVFDKWIAKTTWRANFYKGNDQ